jgi:Cof subfamily protein (haloacid dehalogenase superfamily)
MSDNTLKPIQLIAVDIDHTLLDNQGQLSERNQKALRAALDQGIQVVLATGKTYASAAKVYDALKFTAPGIFSQGTTLYDADGSLRHQQLLDPTAARQIITFVEDRGFSVLAYSGSRVLARALTNPMRELNSRYDEPLAQVVGPLQNILDSVPVNKLLILSDGDARAVRALRWQLEMQLNGSVRLLQTAVLEQLEILPPGASKGAMLRALLRDLKIAPEQVLAIGDAENDIEMIQLAGIGVAMGNARPALRAVAQAVVASNDESGVAEAVERFVLNMPVIEGQSGVAGG